MINDIKKIFRLLKNSYAFKTNLGFAGFFMLYGTVSILRVFDTATMKLIGCMMYVLGPYMIIQSIYSLNFSSMVSASSMRKKLHVTYPAILAMIISIFSLVFTTVVLSIFSAVGEIDASVVPAMVLSVGFIAIFYSIYMAICYKFFIGSIILFLVMFIGLMYSTGANMMTEAIFTLPFSTPVAFLISFVCCIISGGCFYLISSLLYKRPIDKLAMGSRLRNAM